MSSRPCPVCKSIGPKIAEVLLEKASARSKTFSIYQPFRYEDRLNLRGIDELRPGEMATFIAEVQTSGAVSHTGVLIFEMTAGMVEKLRLIASNHANARIGGIAAPDCLCQNPDGARQCNTLILQKRT